VSDTKCSSGVVLPGAGDFRGVIGSEREVLLHMGAARWGLGGDGRSVVDELDRCLIARAVLVRGSKLWLEMMGNWARLGRHCVRFVQCFRCIRRGGQRCISDFVERQARLLLDRKQVQDQIPSFGIQQSCPR